MDPLKRTLKPTFWSEKYTRQFNPNNEYTHRFQSSVKGSKSIQLVDIGEKNTHYTLYKEAIKHLDKKINAIDVGCRDGEFTKYLTWSFDHVFCFDYRKRIQFPMDFHRYIGFSRPCLTYWLTALYLFCLNFECL